MVGRGAFVTCVFYFIIVDIEAMWVRWVQLENVFLSLYTYCDRMNIIPCTHKLTKA